MSHLVCHRIWEVEACMDGRLSGAAASTAQQHRSGCVDCREEWDRLERVRCDLRQLAVVVIDDPRRVRLRRRVLERIDERASGRGPTPAHGGARRALVAATLLVGALCVLLLGFFGGTANEHQDLTRPEVRVRTRSVAQYSRHRFGRREEIRLSDGELSIRVPPSLGRNALVVFVPDGVLRDEGTSFRVSVHDGHTDEIDVFEGTVSFARVGAPTMLLGTGSHWRRSAPRAPEQSVESNHLAHAPDAPSVRSPSPLERRRLGAPTRLAARGSRSPADPPTLRDEDAAYLRVITLTRQGLHADARAAAIRYLDAYPNGFRRREMQHVASTAGE